MVPPPHQLDLRDPAVLDTVLTLQHAAYEAEARLIGSQNIPPLTQSRADLAADGLRYLGLQSGGRLLAAIAISDSPEEVDIHKLMVDPPAHRRGFGRLLLSAVLDRAGSNRRVIVQTAAANQPAVALYESHGFRIIRRWNAPGGLPLVGLCRAAIL
jgi:ribosomal protein S18 acetylase RimI-like enzyme